MNGNLIEAVVRFCKPHGHSLDESWRFYCTLVYAEDARPDSYELFTECWDDHEDGGWEW